MVNPVKDFKNAMDADPTERTKMSRGVPMADVVTYVGSQIKKSEVVLKRRWLVTFPISKDVLPVFLEITRDYLLLVVIIHREETTTQFTRRRQSGRDRETSANHGNGVIKIYVHPAAPRPLNP